MSRYWMLGLVVLHTAVAAHAVAQTQGAKTTMVAPAVKLSDAEKKFDEIVRGFEKRLTESGAFVVDVVSQWQSNNGGRVAQGTNVYHVAVQAGGKLRIEAGSKERGESQFICVSDGRTITRLLRTANLYSQHDAGTTLDELHHDAMTLRTLEGSGVDFLVRPRFRAELIAQISGNVEDLGLEKIGNTDTQHFRVALVGQRVFDLWFTAGNQPVLTRLVITTTIPIDNERTFLLTTTGTFRWQIGGKHAEGTFALAIPEGTRRVDDLLAALQAGDIEQLVGKPAPALELDSLQGTKVNLADQLGKQALVLIFWTSWCAPSSDMMASLNEFVANCEKSGAAVLAINLGEDRALVENAVKEYGYKGTVLLDPAATSVQAYRIGEIPMTFLIGRDGIVQMYQSGSTDEARQRIRSQAAVVIGGPATAPKGP